MKDERLTALEAYRAMFAFLEREWERTGRPDDIGNLLGSMSTLAEGTTADPAVWGEWLDAIDAARTASSELTALNLLKPDWESPR